MTPKTLLYAKLDGHLVFLSPERAAEIRAADEPVRMSEGLHAVPDSILDRYAERWDGIAGHGINLYDEHEDAVVAALASSGIDAREEDAIAELFDTFD